MAMSPSIKSQGEHATTCHFEDASRGDRSELSLLDFHGNTLGQFQMAVIERHRNQSFLERIFGAQDSDHHFSLRC
jgi:hypothetical protein